MDGSDGIDANCIRILCFAVGAVAAPLLLAIGVLWKKIGDEREGRRRDWEDLVKRLEEARHGRR